MQKIKKNNFVPNQNFLNKVRQEIEEIEKTEDYNNKVREEIEKIKKTENYNNIGKAFDFWVLKNYFELDEETVVTNIIDGPNDKKVDAFIEEGEKITIIQCKYFNKIEKKVGGNEIALFKGCLDWLRKPEEIKKLNLPRFYNLASIFSERWNEGIEVQLHFFAFGKFSSEAKHERIVFNNSDLRDRVQMHFHDIDDILKLYKSKLQAQNPLVDEKYEFELIPGEYFIKAKKIPSIVATIKGKDLLKLYEEYGENLFERNIRYFRGLRKESINAKIIDTVLDDNERKNFWYYNNGISFVCRDFKVKGNNTIFASLEVQGFQVINGCQTTVCLSQAKEQKEKWKSIPEDVQVIVRFIKAPMEDVDLITLYTNSQNPVNPLQLKSNDPLQKRLQKELSKSSPPYFYSIKEGDWQLVPKKDKKKFKGKIELANIAQTIYSFNNDPVFARRWKSKLFSEKYNEIFRKDISKEEIILPWRILKVINSKISQYRRNHLNKLKNQPNSFTEDEKIDILKKEFLMYSNLIILHFIGELIHKHYREYSQKIAVKLLNKRLEKRTERMFDYIVDILKYSARLKEEKNLYHFLLNFNNINFLYDEIQRAMEMEKARTKKNPLKDFLPEI
jgi:hypothetical protein